MNSTINLLLRAAIAATATDREKFVGNVSSIIENQVGSSPEMSENIAKGIDRLVAGLDQQLFIQQVMDKSQTDTSELEEKIEQLTETIEKLTKKLDKLSR